MIIVAFPGSGKTHLVKERNEGQSRTERKFMDFDYRGPRFLEDVGLANAQTPIVKYMLNKGVVVCTFISAFNADRLPRGEKIAIFYPDIRKRDEWAKAIRERDGSDSIMVTEIVPIWDSVISKWASYADACSKRHTVKVFELQPGEFISSYTNDEFFKGTPVSK